MDPMTGKLLLAVAQGAGKELVKFIGPLVGLVDAQTKVLHEIQRDLKALIESPFEAARNYVSDAALSESKEFQQRCLLRAEEEFERAAAQQTDPLKASYAWTGSAVIKAHLRPAEKAVIRRHYYNAYLSGVSAGEQTADPAPKKLPAPVDRSIRGWLWVASRTGPARIEIGHWPGSAAFTAGWSRRSRRSSSVISISVPIRGVLRFETYGATKPAKERERRLVEINSHVCALREILVGRGVPGSELPAYRVRLEAGPRTSGGSWPKMEQTYWALVFEKVPDGEDIATCDSPVMLSDGRKRFQFVRLH